MKIATWNVNSVRARLPVVQRWLQESQVDVLAMQETKTVDETFPAAEFEALGYEVAMSGQKTYNGVAIVSRVPLSGIVKGWAGNDPSRILAVDVGGLTLIDGYLPHGGERGDDAFLHKLAVLPGVQGLSRRDVSQRPSSAVHGRFQCSPGASGRLGSRTRCRMPSVSCRKNVTHSRVCAGGGSSTFSASSTANSSSPGGTIV